jgi:methionine aminopeptidase
LHAWWLHANNSINHELCHFTPKDDVTLAWWLHAKSNINHELCHFTPKDGVTLAWWLHAKKMRRIQPAPAQRSHIKHGIAQDPTRTGEALAY